MTTTRKSKVREMVHSLLAEKPETRDNDMYLVTAYWYRQLRAKGVDPSTISGLQMLTYIKNYKDFGLVSFESIRRSRALLQEMHPELRGEEYEKRHAKQQEVVEDIITFKQEVVFDSNRPAPDQPKLF